MNILEQEDLIKGLPDAALMKEASAPSGEVPQFLVISEIKRRSDMRKRFDAQQQQDQGTVKDQIVMEALGIAPMMPAGMTPPAQPMGPLGAPPMGAMPPPMGGMPPMPQGGIASAPQAMPPMRMAQGGIVQMANGGSTGMPGAGALYGMQKEYVDPLLDRAKVLAQTAGISIEEAYEALVRQAQMNMPNYGMLGPAGMGEMPSLEGVDRAVGDAIGSAYAQIPQYSSRDYLGEVGSAAGALADRLPDMPQPPAGTRPPKAVTGGMDVSPFAEGISSLGSNLVDLDRRVTAGIMDAVPNFSMFSNPFGRSDAVKNAPIPMVQTDEEIARNQAYIDSIEAQMDAIDNAQVQGKTDATVQSTGQNRPQTDQNIVPATDGTEPSLVASAVDTVADLQLGSGPADQRASTPDDGLYDGAISSIDQMIADLSGKETQASPVLDLSDVIERSRKGTLAETFMRLGAGVAGGDISKGIAGAADAASKGRQELSRLEMAERIAQTKAGQEDIRRGEQRDLDVAKLGLQREQLNILATRYKNELEKAASVGRNELFRTASAVIDAAMDGSMITNPEERQAKVYELMNEFLTLYAPTFGVTNLPKLPTGGSSAGATVDPAQFET
mgnify:FL=1|tara:strand:+ start:1622 stop:3460 length:1839 start_codon:yes stop_codon:yes gene_type:complete